MKDGTKESYSLNKNCVDDRAIIHALIHLILTIRLRYPKLPRMAREKRQKITRLLLEELVKHCPEHSLIREIKAKINDAEKLSPKEIKIQYPYWQRGDVIIGKDYYQQLFPLSFWLVAKNDFLSNRLRSKFFNEQIHSLDRFLEYLMSASFYPAPSLTEVDLEIILNIIRGTQFNWSRHKIVQLSRKQIIQQFEIQKSRAVLMQRYASIVNSGVIRFKQWLNVRPFGLKMFIREILELNNQEFLFTPSQEILIRLKYPTSSIREWNLVVRREEDKPKCRKGVKFSPVQKIVVTNNLSLRNWSEFLKQPKTILTCPEKDSNFSQICVVQRQQKNVVEFIQRYPHETIRFLEIRSVYPHHKLATLRSVFRDISLYRLKRVSQILREEEILKITITLLNFFPNRLFISLHRQTEEFDRICSFLMKFPLCVWFYTPKNVFLFVYLSHRRYMYGFRNLMEFCDEISFPNKEFQVSLMPISKIVSSPSWFPFRLIKENIHFN